MNKTDKYFLEIPNQTFVGDGLQIQEEPFNHNGFYTHPVLNQENVIECNPFLKWLYNQYEFNCGVIKMSPNILYNFHKDVSRGVCVNVLLEHENSVTLFSEKVFASNSHYSDLIELKYKPKKFYLFNNQIPHGVFNIKGNRSIFSIEFALNKYKLSYPVLKQKVKKWITSTTDI
jgi:hypothetical protein